MGDSTGISKTENSNVNQISPNDYKGVIRNNLILDCIREHPFITPYKLTKTLNIDYSTISRVVAGLEFVKLIVVKAVVDDNNRANKLLFVPNKNFDFHTAFELSKEVAKITDNESLLTNSKEVKGGKS